MSREPIDVAPETFDAASKTFGVDLAGGIGNVYSKLMSTLSGCGSMTGSDPAGTGWADRYDPAATDTASVIVDLSNACIQLAALLERTGFNHGTAESASDPTRAVPTPPDNRSYVVPELCYATPPPARGGSKSPPSGWGIVEHAIGYVWPNGDTGRLRSASAAWSDAATNLGDLAYYVDEAITAISSQQSPEIADATTVCTTMRTHITDTAAECNALAAACSQLAAHIDSAHSDIENEIASFIEWSAGIEAAGGLLSLVSFGAAEVPTQGVEAARVAATGARIAEIIRTLIAAARTVAETISGVVARIAEVAQKLKVILGARLVEATTALVARLPALGDDAGAIAFGRLTFDADVAGLKGTALARQLAKAGEAVVPGAGNTTRIILSSGRYRIPDILNTDAKVIGEVKNVKSLSYTSQLRDYVAYAKEHGYRFALFVRSGDATSLSGPLQQAIRDGDITLFRVIPG